MQGLYIVALCDSKPFFGQSGVRAYVPPVYSSGSFLLNCLVAMLFHFSCYICRLYFRSLTLRGLAVVFSSVVFLFLFLPVLLAVYYCPLAKARAVRNMLLLLASLLFYAWGETLFVFVMLASILINWALTLAMMHSSHKKAFLTTAVVWNVALLFVFKYLAFAARNIAALLPALAIPRFEIALPIGISFFTFQAMSYVFDVYYEKTPAQKSFLGLALYISLFPQLVAGPIVRYSSIQAQIVGREESPTLLINGIIRFVIGLSKKTLLANTIARIADKVFGSELATLSPSAAWIGCLAYFFQIYFDFSGYSDMAIGLGQMFGFHFDENFNYPYLSRTIGEFWRRWHISLGSWFRDYLFYPVLRKLNDGIGKRLRKRGHKTAAKNIPLALALLLVWFTTGLWHGANWTFVIFGLWHGLFIILETLTEKRSAKIKKTLRITDSALWFKTFQTLRTMLIVLVGHVFFRSESISSALTFARRMFARGSLPARSLTFEPSIALLFALCLATSLPIFPALESRLQDKPAWYAVRMVFLTALFFLSVCSVIASAYNPFIYFNF